MALCLSISVHERNSKTIAPIELIFLRKPERGEGGGGKESEVFEIILKGLFLYKQATRLMHVMVGYAMAVAYYYGSPVWNTIDNRPVSHSDESCTQLTSVLIR